MRLLRALLLIAVLVSLVAPSAPCCAESVAEDCCAPTGDCPTTPDGACALTAEAAPGVSVSSPAVPTWASLRSGTHPVPPAHALVATRPIPRDRGRATVHDPTFLSLRI